MIYMGKHGIFVFSVKNQMGPLDWDWICPHCPPAPPPPPPIHTRSCSGPALYTVHFLGRRTAIHISKASTMPEN